MLGKLLFTDTTVPDYPGMIPTNSYYAVGIHKIRIHIELRFYDTPLISVYLLCIQLGWQFLFSSDKTSFGTQEDYQELIGVMLEQVVMLLDGE